MTLTRWRSGELTKPIKPNHLINRKTSCQYLELHAYSCTYHHNCVDYSLYRNQNNAEEFVNVISNHIILHVFN